MSEAAVAPTDVGQFDAGLTEHVVELTRPIVKNYFRSEVRGLDNIPAGPCLVVGNHSGGLPTPDMSVFAVALAAGAVVMVSRAATMRFTGRRFDATR